MPDLLIDGIDPDLFERMRKAADAQGKSLEQIAREVLDDKFKLTKEELIVELRRIRNMTGGVSPDSTPLIREDRDNDEPYR